MRTLGILGVAAVLLSSADDALAQTQPESSGTGFFINEAGWVVTNAHVVEGCSRVSLPGYGDAIEVKTDRTNDLAAVRVAAPKSGYATLPLRARSARLGEDVAALGYPLASVLSSSIKITTGNVNSLLGIGDDTRYLQISAPVQPGNSGGPLVDKTGAVVGVLAATLRNSANGETVPQNVNFAIRAGVLQIFIQSRGIAFEIPVENVPELSTADLADRVAPAVVPVLCFSQPVKGAALETTISEDGSSEETDPTTTPERTAIGFALAYHDAWSSPNDVAMKFMTAVYARPVDFYGSTFSAAEVLSEKRKFAERWPVRGYSLRPETLYVRCPDRICSVSAIIDWFAHSPTRKKSSNGVATFEFDLNTETLTISRETGSVLRGVRANPAGILARWSDQNRRCRGGSGDSPVTWAACEARDYTAQSLAAAGWCYGREGEYGYQMEWHICGRD